MTPPLGSFLSDGLTRESRSLKKRKASSTRRRRASMWNGFDDENESWAETQSDTFDYIDEDFASRPRRTFRPPEVANLIKELCQEHGIQLAGQPAEAAPPAAPARLVLVQTGRTPGARTGGPIWLC
eukprot:4240507-Prymnesium_polylepis.2